MSTVTTKNADESNLETTNTYLSMKTSLTRLTNYIKTKFQATKNNLEYFHNRTRIPDRTKNNHNMSQMESKVVPNRYYAVPPSAETEAPMIAVVQDNSGSMCRDKWDHTQKHLNMLLEEVDQSKLELVCFGDRAASVPDKRLNPNILEHINVCGGGTSILAGLQEMERVVSRRCRPKTLVIIFVSDGIDNSFDQAKVNMLRSESLADRVIMFSVGVGSGFPTRISSMLLSHYQKGNFELPALFQIKDTTKEAQYEEQFRDLSFYLASLWRLSKVEPPLSATPWDIRSSYHPPGTMLATELKELRVNGIIVFTKTELEESEAAKFISQMYNSICKLFMNHEDPSKIKEKISTAMLYMAEAKKAARISGNGVGSECQRKIEAMRNELNNINIGHYNPKKDSDSKLAGLIAAGTGQFNLTDQIQKAKQCTADYDAAKNDKEYGQMLLGDVMGKMKLLMELEAGGRLRF